MNETIYFPHNIDFRGRAYPMPPHLNHLGNDLCRGLLLFQEAKALGPNGLNWLKIQISSLMGQDKISFEDRIRFTEQHLEEIFDSADFPIEGKKWWLKADSPWQCLSACMELTQALRSPNPEHFLSKLPVHQDGTCNGLQHYAALGGDELGAEQVNMTPRDKPQDLYSGVAAKVLEIVTQDAAQGIQEALWMEKRVNRKLVKRTVMTNTYGVTFIGAKKQVLNRLKEVKGHEPDLEPLTDEQMHSCALYITKKIFISMGLMFNGARQIQKWLNKTAALVARSIPAEEIPSDELQLSLELEKSGLLKQFQIVPEEPKNPQEFKSLEEELLSSAEKDSETLQKSLENEPESSLIEEETDDLDELNILNKPPVMIAKDKKAPVKMTSVIWTTPLGLPVVQPYRNWKSQVVSFFSTIFFLQFLLFLFYNFLNMIL